MDAVISSQRKATTEQDSPVLTLNGTDGAEDERFIAVTRQEELLLAAMRAKRALMRESHQASGIEGLEGRVKDERTASKKESLSSIKTVKANTLLPLPLNVRPSGASNNNSSDKIDNVNNDEMAMLFPKPPTTKPSPTTRADGTSEVDSGSEEVMVCLDRTISEMQPLDMADMSPDLRDLMHYKSKQLPAPPSSSTHSATRSSRSRTSSAAPANTTPKRERHEANPRPDSDFMPAAGPLSAQIHGKPDVAIRSEWHPTDIEPVMERPDSSSSYYEEESEIEKQPPSRMRQVRISAVGMQLPEIGQWGDDG
ncbi:hypothetical protein SLS53_001651 [Cytospora paraplurivora]|uniref:Uncharacterized protein n=1 Tax=Cytospora paraplurivora TaxID=2898453 RepID=A0AAN9UGQ0_9PEZI